ncbi:MAG TPA: CpsB/CapC family capsule biosynthesis tyrosine phosphatase [Chitinophagaceae bacterium]|nr:CpsB/CapC family capsule biosynthesis tyrosine phosphatase [Chitinophagaceae bacterium]
MFSYFKKTKNILPDLSFIGADMHSHLLPDLDDGLKTIEETLLFIDELSQLGYRKLICTPHIICDMYPNNPDTILPKLEMVRTALKQKNIDVCVEAAAEYMVDLEMEKYVLSGQPLLTFGNNLILIEMSYIGASPNIEQVIFQLRLKGLQPVIAHPERYIFYYNELESYQRFIDLGCLLQVNLLSLLGYYGKPVKIIAEKLLKNKMVDLLGTDLHHERHLAALKELALKKGFYKMMEGVGIKNKELLM